MYLSVYLPVYLSIYLCIYLSIYLASYLALSICQALSTCQARSTYQALSTCQAPSMYMSIYLSFYLSSAINQSFFLSISFSIFQISLYLTIHLPVCLSVCLSVYLPACARAYPPVCLSTVCVSGYVSKRSSSKLLRKDDGHASGFLSLCIRSMINILSFFVRSRRNLQRSWLTDFFRSCRRHGPSKAGSAQQHFRAFSLSLSLSFSLLSVRAMFIPEFVQRRAKSLNQVVLLAAPNAMA